MIVAVRANQPSFTEVRFGPGFNVVMADRTKESRERDSRNGLGKTTLIEIIHFCLGSNLRKGQGLRSSNLSGWSFTLDLYVDGRELSVTRSVDRPSRIWLEGDVKSHLMSEPRRGVPMSVTRGNVSRSLVEHVMTPGLDLESTGEPRRGVSASDWVLMLGEWLFGLTVEDEKIKYRPTFRSLFSYLARREREGFISPFSHHLREGPWARQVNNAFLLGLAWEHASQFQELKNEERTLNSLRTAAREGLLKGMVGTLGVLEAERARLALEWNRQEKSLKDFRVHPEYSEIEREANELTSSIQELTNANYTDARRLRLYQDSLEEEDGPDAEDVVSIYNEAGIIMPNLVERKLSEVEQFHRQLLTNRRDYLQSEIQRIEHVRIRRTNTIQEYSDRRAELLEILRAYGALEEYTRLQGLLVGTWSELKDVETRIANLKRFEEGKSEVRVRRERLLQAARREFEERRQARQLAINLFNSNSQALYEAPGNLVVEIDDTGFKFDVEIMRAGSQGIENMQIFCYDLVLVQLWTTKRPGCGILIHDSTIFDGVDERQRAKALELAAEEAEARGFQYVCALNSDMVPTSDFSRGFDLDQFVRLRLTDESESGGLLGIRY